MDYDQSEIGLKDTRLCGTLKEYSREPHFLKVDKRIKETQNEIEYMEKMLASKKTYLKQLETVRKIVKPADEAKIQALISAGLL